MSPIQIEVDDFAVERVLEFFLEVLKVAMRGSVFHLSRPADHPGVVQDVLHQRGFSGACASGEGNVADVRGGVLGHGEGSSDKSVGTVFQV